MQRVIGIGGVFFKSRLPLRSNKATNESIVSDLRPEAF